MDVPLPHDLKPRAAAAIGDRRLQLFVNRATVQKDTQRKAAFREAFADRYDDLRDLAGRIKQHTLDYLDYYLKLFIERAEAAGVRVHFAGTARQANEICVRIARDHRCRLCVKSKSMVTEETGLVPALEAAGVETVETDLGEFILQLDREPPSHIVTPMIHKDRTAVGRAFERELGVPYTDEPRELTMIARRHLRERYRRADLGVSGANFLVAETGSMVLCTNEGNGRFCTAVPRVHVALAGIEKVIPRLDHLAVFLKLLARSSTAQPLTCYTQIITGPRRGDEVDGPDEVHVILVDNGRTELLREPTREILRCIRCGACLNACPVYRKIGGHAYGGVYSGPIGALITPLFKGLENYPDLPRASSLCGACYEACPVKIDIPRQLIRLRSEMVRRDIRTGFDRLIYRIWAWSLSGSIRYRCAGWLARRVLRLMSWLAGTMSEGECYSSRGWIQRLIGPAAGWTSERDLPTPPAASFRDWWNRRKGKGV